MKIYKIVSHPRVITILGVIGLADGFVHLILPTFSVGHESSFDLSYYAANEAMFFASAITLFISGRLDTLEKRIKSLEGQKLDSQ